MAKLKSGTDLIPVAAEENGIVTAQVKGEIDLHNSPELRDALLNRLLRHAPKQLILNLQQVPYMDSSAIAVLVETLQKLRPQGGTIRLTHLQPRVRALLEIARLDAIFELEKEE